MTLPELAERLEKATEFSRDLAFEMCDGLGIAEGGSEWEKQYWRLIDANAFLDAAVALCERVLEGCHWSVTNAATKPRANVWMPEVIRPIMGPYSSAPTPALALCLAIVRAKLAELPSAPKLEEQG